MAKYVYQIRLRTDREIDEINTERLHTLERYRGLGERPDIGEWPRRLVIERYDSDTQQREEIGMNEISTQEKYELFFGRYIGIVDVDFVYFKEHGTSEEISQFKFEMNENLTPEEVVKILRAADAKKMDMLCVSSRLNGIWRFDEAYTIAKYNALKQGRVITTVEECAKAAEELIELRNAININR